jgi:hypothetical protein
LAAAKWILLKGFTRSWHRSGVRPSEEARMIDARIENGQVDLYDASSGMYKRTIRPGSSPASVEADRDEVSITFENGSVDVYSTQGLYKRTIGQAPPTS